jgi:hypothetical protein
MKKWLTSFFLLLALASGVIAGAPLHSGNMNSQTMKCCKKMKNNGQVPASSLARLHCAINCTDSSPSPGGSSTNFSPSGIKISDSISKQIALLLSAKQKSLPTSAVKFECPILPRKIPPKYIQHHSILI